MAEAPRVTWKVHLARRHPGRALIGAVAFLVVSWGVGVAGGGVTWGIFAGTVLLGSTTTFWFPRRYALFDDRLEVTPWGWRRPMVYPLARFRTAFVDKSSVFLSPTEETTGIARFRGLTVHLNPEDAHLAAEIVQSLRKNKP